MEKAVKEAIARGRASVTMGPLLLIQAVTENGSPVLTSGDVAYVGSSEENVKITVKIDYFTRKDKYVLDEKDMRVTLESSKGRLEEIPVSCERDEVSVTLSSKDVKWLRAELYGKMCGKNTLIAFTNPIYFCERPQEGSNGCFKTHIY